MAGLSIIVITLNEESNIGPCLESVRWADDIIVLDSGSTDRTKEIAKKFTRRVFSVKWEGYGGTRNLGLERAKREWVLWLDADERVTPELGREIQEIVGGKGTAASGYAMARRAYFLGKWIRHCGWYPGRVTRLFKKSGARFTSTRVHEGVTLPGIVLPMHNDIVHLTDPDLDHYFRKFNRYTMLAAWEMHEAGRKASLFDLFIRPPFAFIKMYFLRLGFLDGLHGLVLCVLSSAYVFVKYAKLWDLSRRGPAGERPSDPTGAQR